MEKLDQWIIGLLVMALSGVLWFLLLDTRSEVRSLEATVIANSSRLTALEQRALWLERTLLEMKDDLNHRYKQTVPTP